MANQELFKHENAVRKAEGAWDRQMKRDGHLKKESRDISTAEPQHMSPTARAFYHEYTNAKAVLDAEAERTDLFGDSPATGKQGGTAPPLNPPGNVIHLPTFKNPDDIGTPDGLTRKIVAPQMLVDLRAIYAGDSLMKDKPTAKVVPLDGQHWVVVEVAEHYVVLNRCIPENDFTGNTFPSMKDGQREAPDWDGLLFKSGPGRSPSFVMVNSAQSMAVLAGDPLAGVALDEGKTGTDDE